MVSPLPFLEPSSSSPSAHPTLLDPSFQGARPTKRVRRTRGAQMANQGCHAAHGLSPQGERGGVLWGPWCPWPQSPGVRLTLQEPRRGNYSWSLAGGMMDGAAVLLGRDERPSPSQAHSGALILLESPICPL